MKKRIKRLLFFFVSLICAGWVIYIFQPCQSGSGTPPAQKKTLAPQIVLTNIQQTHLLRGEKKWTLTADTARLSSNGDTSILKDIALTALTASGATVLISADRGVFNKKTGEMKVSGNVIINDPMYKIQTQSLHYQDKNGMIYTNDFVTIDGNSLHLKGDSMQYDITTMEAVLTGNIQGILQSTPAQP